MIAQKEAIHRPAPAKVSFAGRMANTLHDNIVVKSKFRPNNKAVKRSLNEIDNCKADPMDIEVKECKVKFSRSTKMKNDCQTR